VAAQGDSWRPDRVIVLTSSTATIENHILRRNRPHENVAEMVRRFRLIDAEFRRLAPASPNTVVINRDGLEFHDRAGLNRIITAAGLPPFNEIPYLRLD
jgi:deoxyadenosine/deoxycytidine kinase